ncbi:unnamed protein product [Effrenium voratum]|nr:unnamed protein product [Effrenium voratum]
MALLPETREIAKAILEADEPVNLKVAKLNSIWLQNNLASHEKMLPSKMMVHPHNRGGNLMNGHDMLAKGLSMMEQGVRVDLLESSAVCFALSRDLQKRQEQIDANSTLSDQFPGVMPRITGEERFLTVASHSTAFLKAVMQGLHAGSTDATKTVGHPVHRCCTEGWTWLVLSDLLEEAFPTLPLLYASALNASNTAQVESTEVEILATLSKHMQMGKTVEEAIAATKQGSPSCSDYIDVIAVFAKRFTGGQGMPLAQFLQAFSKVYGKSIMVGSDFMRTVTFTDFKIQGELMPLFRIACLACQIASPKIVDKIGRLVTKSDVEKLKGKAKLLDAEDVLRTAWSAMQVAGHVAEGQKRTAFGRCCLRVVLHMTQKEKQGRENKEWPSLQAIGAAFAEDMLGMAASSLSTTTQQASFDNLLDTTKTGVLLMQNPHLQVGSNYTNSEHGSKLFTLVSVADEMAKFEHKPYFGDVAVLDVAMDGPLQCWKKSKRDVPAGLSEAEARAVSVSNSSFVKASITLAEAQVKLYNAFVSDHDDVWSKIQVFAPPAVVVASVSIPARQLILTAYGQLVPVKENAPKGKGSYYVDQYLLQAPKAVADFDKIDGKTALVPFWYVRCTNEFSEVNMQLVHQVLDGMSVPSFRSMKDLSPGDTLCYASENLVLKQAQASSAPSLRPAKRIKAKGTAS